MLDARKLFYLVTLRNSSEDQNNKSLFLSNSKEVKKKILVHFSITTHEPKMSPGFSELQRSGREGGLRGMGEKQNLYSKHHHREQNVTISFWHRHKDPQLY